MKKRLAIGSAIFGIAFWIAGATLGAAAPLTVTGAGATFPYPLYSKWFYAYSNAHPGVNFNYQSIGSGGGIKQITAGTVDFGASDAPMKDEDMAKLPGPIFHIPTAIGAVTVVYNLNGVDSGLKLTSDEVADIFLGKITKWNDPRIVSHNPGMKLPAAEIVVAHRSDGSGTTDIFTNYLSTVNTEWKEKVGRGKSVNWPVGLGGKGNEGVAGVVKQTPGAIGYVELAYSTQNKMTVAAVKNRDGSFVLPSLESTSAAAAGAAKTMPADYRVALVDAPGKESYPICGLTWLLIYQNQKDESKGKALVSFLKWAMHDGQKMNAPLLYAPIPAPVVEMVDKTLKQIKYEGKSLY
jgi:phosphate transport system substrate-binding protein